jgi:hypothetical protein
MGWVSLGQALALAGSYRPQNRTNATVPRASPLMTSHILARFHTTISKGLGQMFQQYQLPIPGCGVMIQVLPMGRFLASNSIFVLPTF